MPYWEWEEKVKEEKRETEKDDKLTKDKVKWKKGSYILDPIYPFSERGRGWITFIVVAVAWKRILEFDVYLKASLDPLGCHVGVQPKTRERW